MAQIKQQDEFVKFLKILRIKVQEHEKAFKNFLVQINRSTPEMLHDCTDTKQKQEQEPVFTCRP